MIIDFEPNNWNTVLCDLYDLDIDDCAYALFCGGLYSSMNVFQLEKEKSLDYYCNKLLFLLCNIPPMYCCCILIDRCSTTSKYDIIEEPCLTLLLSFTIPCCSVCQIMNENKIRKHMDDITEPKRQYMDI